ncbi:MBL fold metallo-hydrolase, partial [Candidatus Peregrinibacteria bacterium]|nr:MBL fold metallo-hydrolase [Candidatus Peregrinibacteria bacterium]
IELKFFNTPGHTNDSICIFVEGIVFTGDTMLIGGCGRTDFQNGSAQDLYESIFNKLLTLPDLTKVYPGHDYKERFCSTIKEERENSPRLQLSKEDFIQTLDNHHPGLPEKFKESVQENSK